MRVLPKPAEDMAEGGRESCSANGLEPGEPLIQKRLPAPDSMSWNDYLACDGRQMAAEYRMRLPCRGRQEASWERGQKELPSNA